MPARVLLGVGRWGSGLMPMVFLGQASLGTVQPGSPCTWLTPAQLQQTMGQSFGAPKETSVMPAFQGQAAGTQCEYQSTRHSDVVLMAYTDHSADEAKKTFETMAAAYRAKTKPGGIGDDSYMDKHSIHVLKGKVRYYIDVATGVTGGDPQALAITFAKIVLAHLAG